MCIRDSALTVFKKIFLSLLFSAGLFSQKSPITTAPWQEVVISVSNLDRTAEFFKSIGGYEETFRGRSSASSIKHFGLNADASAEELLLAAKGATSGFVRLIRFDNAGYKQPMRPGSRAWDSGCYFSLMVRMKDIRKIYDEAIAMGWWTETPIAKLSFGTSRLEVVIFKGPDGVQVQGYERLTPALPKACLLYTSPSPRDATLSRMPSSA